MKNSRAYRSVSVNRICLDALQANRDGIDVDVGLDVSKDEVMAVLRWCDGEFERPWKVRLPGEIEVLVPLLRELSIGRSLRVAMESTGTYGDALRQALTDVDLAVHRVGGKATHDYAEIFDGVPSQHDGKDAAIVAELTALGKSQPWPYRPLSDTDQEMAYWVDWMDAQRLTETMWIGRLEALSARHWPEVTRLLKLPSVTLLEMLAFYGGPGGVANDAAAADRLAGWGGHYLRQEKITKLLASAQETVGVRQGRVDVTRMQQYAQEALTCRRAIQKAARRLRRLARNNEVIQAQGAAIGVATACVLWVSLGSPLQYHCGEAYRKSMGLNLKERSSGRYHGQLKITKRGPSRVRRWLYFAALRTVKDPSVKKWHAAKKAKHGDKAKLSLVGVMRRLAMALWHVPVHGEAFDAASLFPGQPLNRQAAREVVSC